MTPDTFWNMTMMEFHLACEGFAKFHGGNKSAPLTKDELKDLMERYPD